MSTDDVKISRIPYKIGITGTIASGKSWVGQILESAGVAVIDTDTVVKTLKKEDQALRQALVEAFGIQTMTSEGLIDDVYLGGLAFNEPVVKQKLEQLIHPKVRQCVNAFFEDKTLPQPIRAALVPLLFEGKTESLYDTVWTVTVEPDVLMERLMRRNNLTQDAASRRLANQWSQAQKAERANHIIDNSGTPEETKRQVLALLEPLQKQVAV